MDEAVLVEHHVALTVGHRGDVTERVGVGERGRSEERRAVGTVTAPLPFST